MLESGAGTRVGGVSRVTSGEVVAGPGEGRTPVILLAEDDVLVRFMTAEILRDAGYIVLEAVDASEALSLIGTGHPLDLVVSDVRMPGQMDGAGLTYAIKELRPSLPIVLISSHLEPRMTHAAEAFLSKPYSPSDLLKLAEQFVGAQWQTRLSGPTAS
jgi:CheY-like chemotaxis protein